MTRSIGRFCSVLMVLLSAVAMFGCTTTRQTSVKVGDAKDLVTASDEPDTQKRARARMELASAYFSRGQSTTALDQVKQAISADPTYGQAFNLRGLIYASLGEEVLAKESFKRALQINPRDADTMHNYGFYLCRLKRYDEATALFDRALAVPQYRGGARTLLAQGVCQAYAGKLAESESSLLRANEMDPGNPVALTNLAEVLYRRGDYERARFQIRRVNAQPAVSNAQTLWLAARIEHKIGNDQGALDFARQVRNRFPDSREAAVFARGAFDE